MIFFGCSLFVMNEMRENISEGRRLRNKNVTYECCGMRKRSSSRRK